MADAERIVIRMRWIDLVIGYRGHPIRAIGTGQASSDRLLVVEGPNGSGKTTLLKTLAGILPPVDGVVDPRPDPSRTTFVHSTPWLFRGSVRRNLVLAGERSRAEREADRLGVRDLLELPASELSAGQAQRIALARAMTRAPQILLLDEPEGSLDSESLERWTERIHECVREGSPLIILATHRRRAWDVPFEIHRM